MALTTKLVWGLAKSVAKSVATWIRKAIPKVKYILKKTKPTIRAASKLATILNEGRKITRDSASVTIQRSEDSPAKQERRARFHLDLIELVVWSQVVHRFSNNIEIHAAHLNTHFQTLQNMVGMLALSHNNHEAVTNTVDYINKVVTELKNSDSLTNLSIPELQSPELPPKAAHISIENQYKAFELTREVLAVEVKDFKETLTAQLRKAEQLSSTAIALLGPHDQLTRWINKDVLTSIKAVRDKTNDLRFAIKDLPQITITGK
jgi:hypothetical protein